MPSSENVGQAAAVLAQIKTEDLGSTTKAGDFSDEANNGAAHPTNGASEPPNEASEQENTAFLLDTMRTEDVDSGSKHVNAIPEATRTTTAQTQQEQPQWLKFSAWNSGKADSGHGNIQRLELSETYSLARKAHAADLRGRHIGSGHKRHWPRASIQVEGSQHGCELYRDRVFTKDDWQSHISFRRYLPEPAILGQIFTELAYPICVVLLVTVACHVYEEAIRRAEPEWPSLHDFDVNFTYNLCSFALSLLLVFKTNTCYARFWEARSAWASAYTACRIFILKVQAWAPDLTPPMRKALLRWTIALPYVLRSHLLDYVSGSEALEELLLQEEVTWLRREQTGVAPHRPIKAVSALLALLQESGIVPVHVMDISNVLKSYLDTVAVLERIKHTPIPMPYTRHTTRFILVYTFFMPIVLWRSLEWGTYLVVPMITMLLAGIDNIGMHIENPINILPMSAYCSVIHDNLLVAAGDWSMATAQDSHSMVKCALTAQPPPWQAQPTNLSTHILSCAGSIGDVVLDTAPPASYRFGRASNESPHGGYEGESQRGSQWGSQRGSRLGSRHES